MPTVISVSTWLPIPSVLSACYCLDRRCVLKSLVTSKYDRIINSASTTNSMPPFCCAQQNLYLTNQTHNLDSHRSQEEETYGTSQSPSQVRLVDQGYLPDNVDGRLPDPDDDTENDICTRYDDCWMDSRI